MNGTGRSPVSFTWSGKAMGSESGSVSILLREIEFTARETWNLGKKELQECTSTY